MSDGRVLQGQHAVVTGGGRGIGAAIARALAARGANVTVMGRTAPPLATMAAAIAREFAVRSDAQVCDVGNPDEVARAFDKAVQALGPVQALVNNAGHSSAAAVEAIALEEWDATLRINLTGALLCIRQVLPPMVAAGTGRIVNVASTAGLKGYAKTAAYCASKHGLVGLTRAVAVETARSGVTVNAVCPGYTDDTGMLQLAIANIQRDTGASAGDARARLTKPSPRGSLITPQEVAAAVVWLCSPEASAITGQAIAVAAGEVM